MELQQQHYHPLVGELQKSGEKGDVRIIKGALKVPGEYIKNLGGSLENKQCAISETHKKLNGAMKKLSSWKCSAGSA
eukprot:5156671-Ditylum_brightwellii.AAC.1